MRAIWLIVVLFLSGCSSIHIPEDFTYKEIQTTIFKLASWQKMENATAPVKIYIEGDGAAFNAEGQPTRNPTPKGKLLREIAFGDMSPNVVYLARACQFVDDDKCVQKYWTTARFAPEVIQSAYEAIYKIAKGREVILVGFSGGAQVAGLVAVLHPDVRVKKLISVGGNLDHYEWTEYHNLPSLKDSLNLADYREKYLMFPQFHFVGENDTIMPPVLNQNFMEHKNVYVVKGASHGNGWEVVYPQIWNAM